MALPPNFLDEIRARTTLSEVVGRRVRLIRSNREFKGCCPFHDEKTPSFTVNDQKGFFHCFGCGAHGDVIGFVMRHDNLGFMDTVEMLAAEAGLEVPKPSPQAAAQEARRRTLHDLVDQACRWFEGRLAAPDGRHARDYLARRGLSAETIAEWRLGFAPADSRALIGALTGDGWRLDDLIEAGLARRPDDGRDAYSFFRSRVLFPVEDRRGRVVAFGGRLMDGDGPKYINSPDTPLFHKGRLLYGLTRARRAAGNGKPVLVVEGYMDVIALNDAGLDGAVAPLGTALTEEQIEEIWRLIPGDEKLPVLCFDGDTAGRRAAWRAVDRLLPALGPGKSARIAYLPAGEDPDSLIRGGGGDTMARLIDQAVSLADVVWEKTLADKRTDTPEARAGIEAALEQQVRTIGDASVQHYYRSDLRARLREAFGWKRAAGQAMGPGRQNPSRGRGRFAGRGAGRGFETPPASPRPPPAIPQNRGEQIFLAAMVNHPTLIDENAERLAVLELADPGLDALRHALLESLAAGTDTGPDSPDEMTGDLDSPTLARHLNALGLGEVLEKVLSPAVMNWGPFARPERDIGTVRERLDELWSALGRQHLMREVAHAGRTVMTVDGDAGQRRLAALISRAKEGLQSSDDEE